MPVPIHEEPPPKQIKNTIYDKMTFPRWQFREFPLAVPMVDGAPCFDEDVMKKPYDFSNPRKPKPYPIVVVNSEEELAALQGGAETLPVSPGAPAGTQRVETEEDVRKGLYAQAEAAGVTIDRRWSTERIENALAAAEEKAVL